MDPEKLRNKYNSYYSQIVNKWGSESMLKAERVVKTILKKVQFNSIQKKIGKTLLDVGCGTGYYTEAFRKKGFPATGLDYSEIAIKKAKNNFPQCKFVHMNGFEPKLDTKFDLIFCRGFSGANTHDLNYVSVWANKYIKLLNDNGVFIFSYSTNYSGKEKEGETVNWLNEEIREFFLMINAEKFHYFVFHYYGFISFLKKYIFRILFRSTRKDFFYLFFQKK